MAESIEVFAVGDRHDIYGGDGQHAVGEQVPDLGRGQRRQTVRRSPGRAPSQAATAASGLLSFGLPAAARTSSARSRARKASAAMHSVMWRCHPSRVRASQWSRPNSPLAVPKQVSMVQRGTKACVIADGAGRTIAFRIAPVQAHGLPRAVPLLDQLPGVPLWVVAGRGYSSHRFRQHIREAGAKSAIPSKRNEAPARCPDWIFTNSNRVERLWARLKEWRAVATGYEKTAVSFAGVLCLAATLDWIK